MIEGRVVGDHDLGSGFCLADRIVATAAHVVTGHDAGDLAFVTSSGARVEVERVQVDPAIDVALLWVRRSLAVEPILGHAREQADWQVTARPDADSAQLSGTITAVDHLMTNADRHEMTVLQLEVRQDLKNFAGYSGSAVVMDKTVVGILVEQVQERVAAPGTYRRAANVLYAVPIGRVITRFRLGATVHSRPEKMPVHRLLETAHFDMDALKSAILSAISDRDDRTIAFGLPDVDMMVVGNLTQWLGTYIGEVKAKGELKYVPLVMSRDTMAYYVTRYVPDLDRINIVCPVRVDGVDTELVVDLWNRIRAACTGARRRLIIFFVGVPSAGYPELVDVLPSPSVRQQDIADWTRHVVAARRWPSPLAEPWTTEIVARASVQGQLDVRVTYETLEHYIELVRLEPSTLLSHLEELEASC